MGLSIVVHLAGEGAIMTDPLWQHPIGSGVIDCDFDAQKRVVVAGDVTGRAVCLSYDNDIEWEDTYSMPIWGASIAALHNRGSVFAFALASKRPEAGELIVASKDRTLYTQEFGHPGWDTAFIRNSSLVAVTTWEGLLYVVDYLTGEVQLNFKSQASMFGLAQDATALYITASGRGLLQWIVGANTVETLAVAPQMCYNVCLSNANVLTGSNTSSLYLIDRNSSRVTAVNRHGADICSVAVYEKYCFTGDFEGNILVSEVAKPQATLHAEHLPDTIWNLAIDETNKRVFVACGDGSLYSYDLDAMLTEPETPDLVSRVSSNGAHSSRVGNGKVFISHAHQDNARCMAMLHAMDAWKVDYWFDTESMRAGDPLSRRIQAAIADHDIFIRVCTRASQQSYWVELETDSFRGMQAQDYHAGDYDKRTLINLILDGNYIRGPFDHAAVFIDAVGKSDEEWMDELRRALRKLNACA